MTTYSPPLKSTQNLNIMTYDFYTVENCGNILAEYVKTAKKLKQRNKEYLWNVPAAFDIETSSFYIAKEKRACMYVWQMAIDDIIIIGRTWPEFVKLINILEYVFSLSPGECHLIIFVHNLSYEFQFMRKWLDWHSVFATDNRKVLKCVSKNGVEFRCSYLLSGYSLDYIGKNLIHADFGKMTGDLDYRLIRHSGTPLSEKELGYCINDVRVVVQYIRECIQRDGDIRRLQLTKTGYIRKFTRDKIFERGYKKNRALMNRLTLTTDSYRAAVRAFAGGFTHASCLYSGAVLTDVMSFDISSSYPTVICAEKRFPMGHPRFVENIEPGLFEKYLSRFACIFDITFYNIKPRLYFEHYISRSKCREVENAVTDNGRIVSADKITMTITEVDYDIITRFYTWENISVSNLYYSMRGYLPKEFILSVLQLFADKTELKGVAGKEMEYNQRKEYINSEYGQCVTAVCRDEFTYSDDEWGISPGDFEKQIDNYNNSPKRVLFYWWGIFITALARHNLFELIENCGTDYVYSDTDSVKMINGEKHLSFIEEYNKRIIQKLYDMAKFYNIPAEMITPKTIKGDIKTLGVYEFEKKYTRFKTLGAKRYLTEFEENGELKLSLTVAGLNKKVALPYLIKKYKNNDGVFNAFSENLEIPAEFTGKLTHTYIDNECSGDIVDYMGNCGHFHELSYIHLEPASYVMSLTEQYIQFLKGVKQRND